MLCPVTQQPMVIVEIDGIELDVCIDGKGVWFDSQELELLCETLGADVAELRDLSSQFRTPPPSSGDLGPKRPCPRCGALMDHVLADADPEPVVLDSCPHGHGLWFDDGELHQILTKGLEPGHPALERIQHHLFAFQSGPAADADAPEETD